jgi:hypothetical protein
MQIEFMPHVDTDRCISWTTYQDNQLLKAAKNTLIRVQGQSGVRTIQKFVLNNVPGITENPKTCFVMPSIDNTLTASYELALF